MEIRLVSFLPVGMLPAPDNRAIWEPGSPYRQLLRTTSLSFLFHEHQIICFKNISYDLTCFWFGDFMSYLEYQHSSCLSSVTWHDGLTGHVVRQSGLGQKTAEAHESATWWEQRRSVEGTVGIPRENDVPFNQVKQIKIKPRDARFLHHQWMGSTASALWGFNMVKISCLLGTK